MWARACRAAALASARSCALGHLADEALLECGDGVAEQVRLPIQLPEGSLGDILGPAQRRDGLVQDSAQDPLLDGLLSRCEHRTVLFSEDPKKGIAGNGCMVIVWHRCWGTGGWRAGAN